MKNFFEECGTTLRQEGLSLDKEHVRNALPFETLLQHYNIIIVNGHMLSCPFHGDDSKPSATIKNNFFYCFTCGAKHDVFSFVMDMESCSFAEALQFCAVLTGIAPTQSRAEVAQRVRRTQHEQGEKQRVDFLSEKKYSLLAKIARFLRSKKEDSTAIDALLNTWLHAVPLWADLRPLAFALGGNSTENIHRALQRLCQEKEVYNV